MTLSSGKHLASLRHQHQPLADDAGSRIALDAAAEEQHAPSTGRLRPRQRAHQRRLAGAVGAEHGDQLALLDLEIDVADHVERAVAGTEPLGGEQRCRSGRQRLLAVARGVQLLAR